MGVMEVKFLSFNWTILSRSYAHDITLCRVASTVLLYTLSCPGKIRKCAVRDIYDYTLARSLSKAQIWKMEEFAVAVTGCRVNGLNSSRSHARYHQNTIYSITRWIQCRKS